MAAARMSMAAAGTRRKSAPGPRRHQIHTPKTVASASKASKTITAKMATSNRNVRPRSGLKKDSLPVPQNLRANIIIDDSDNTSNEITREDIEREKRNLNLDNFIRKLSMPDVVVDGDAAASLEINLEGDSSDDVNGNEKVKVWSKHNVNKKSSTSDNGTHPPSIVVDAVSDDVTLHDADVRHDATTSSDVDVPESWKSSSSLLLPEDLADKACSFISKSISPPASFKEVVREEIDRPEGVLDEMIRRSQLVAAFGRRLFDEKELQETTSEDEGNEDSEDKKNKKKRKELKVVQSRYLQMFEKKEDVKDKGPEYEIAAEEALAIIEENPTNFGVWDRFLDPTSAKVRVEKVRRQKSANQQIMENEIKLLELNEMKKAREESDYEEEVKEKETKDPPFRNLVETGKYLHENDIRWCKANTKFGEKDIIKWFRRFRSICPRGDMTRENLAAVYHKIFVGGGESDFFSKEIFRRFDTAKKKCLDFKVYLFIIQICTFSSVSEKLLWIFQLLDLDDAGIISAEELECAVRLYEAIERPLRGECNYDKPYDLTLERTAAKLQLRSLEERMDRIRNHLDASSKFKITKAKFAAIPTRIISATEF